MREHAVAQVVKVGRARAKIFVVGALVTGDLLLHGFEPRAVRGAARDDGEKAGGENVVLGSATWDFQDAAA